MKIIKLIIVAVLITMWSCGEKEKPVPNDTVSEITTEVRALAVDKNNTLWVATKDSLYKSVDDGYKHVKLSVAGSIYSLFCEASENILWIGTETALIKATITDGELTENIIDNSNLSYPKVVALHIDNNSKHWFGTEKGFSLNYADTWKKENFRINALNNVFPMDIEDFPINSIANFEGSYFFATSGAKLYRAFDYNESVDAFSGATQWDPPYNGQSVTDTMFVVFVDNAGKQWMGGTQGIQVHTGQDAKDVSSFEYYYDELPDNYALVIKQDTDGNIWVGTRKGVAVFNGTAWETITTELPDPYVTALAFEGNGVAWIGTKKGLVSME